MDNLDLDVVRVKKIDSIVILVSEGESRWTVQDLGARIRYELMNAINFGF
jgi:hypothetical protein